jgi:hypothetical protein
MKIQVYHATSVLSELEDFVKDVDRFRVFSGIGLLHQPVKPDEGSGATHSGRTVN